MRLNYLLFSLLLPFGVFGQAPTVSNIAFDGVSHSAVRATFSASANFYWLRTRYIASPGTCTDGVSGTLQGSSYSNFGIGSLHQGDGNKVVIGGLSPDTTYQVCPEISADFSQWSSGVGATVKTAPMPGIHPMLPNPPVTFNTDYPSTVGYNNVTVSSDCNNLLPSIESAIQNQLTTGTVINIPAGTVCTGPYNLSRRAPDAVTFAASAVNTSANTINSSNHGFTEGQGIVFGTSYGCLPGSLTNPLYNDCHKSGPIISGQMYFAHVVDSSNIQIYSGAAKNSGGTLCQLLDGGSGTEYFVHWPRPLKWVVIRTSTTDAQFTPEHVRTSPAWAPKMAVLQAPAFAMAGSLTANTLMSVGDFDGNNMAMTANIRFVGLEFTYAGNRAASSSSDPLPWYTLFGTVQTDQNIVVDRCYFHGLGTPNRVYNAIAWDGMNVSIVDSYMDNLEYFHSIYSGLELTKVN